MNKDPHRKHETNVKLAKNKRDYQVGSGYSSHQQSPSPVNYYASGGFDLKPPASPWSNQFYPANNQFHSNNFYQPSSQLQQTNLASLLAKCSERNLYYCKELFAKQLVQHVREMVTYRNGLDPYFFSTILGSLPSMDSWKAPFARTEIRTETDLLDNEIPQYEPQLPPMAFQRPEKGHVYQTNTQWNPVSWNAGYSSKPTTLGIHSWNEHPYYKPQDHSSPQFYPNAKPYFQVPQGTDYFKPSAINHIDPPLHFPYNNGAHQDGVRESKDYPVNVPSKPKVCNPCAPSSGQNIDIRHKAEVQQETKLDNSTVPTSRA